MFRALILLALLPTYAVAEWSPRPAMFSYDATFDRCAMDPTAPKLAADCAALLDEAYALKRAVARAAHACGDDPLATCAAPFEDEGLPAIAVRIAVDVGCDGTAVATLPVEPLPVDHCVAIASDIMIDEGVVPLDTMITCTGDDCRDLAALHSQLWKDAVIALAGDDPLIRDLIERTDTDCTGSEGPRLICAADQFSALWADLSQSQEAN